MESNDKVKELQKDESEENKKIDILMAEEIEIEEMAIDGICGVY